MSNFIHMKTRQLDLTKINSSARRCVFSRKWVKFSQDKLFSISKSEHFLRMHIERNAIPENLMCFRNFLNVTWRMSIMIIINVQKNFYRNKLQHHLYPSDHTTSLNLGAFINIYCSWTTTYDPELSYDPILYTII